MWQASPQEEFLPLPHGGQGQLLHCGDHPQSERVRGEGEEEDGSGQLQEEGRHPLPSQMEIYCVGF